MSVIKNIIPLGPVLISTSAKNAPDGYSLTIRNEGANPTIFIDAAATDGYTIEFAQDGYIGSRTGTLVLGASSLKITEASLITLNSAIEGSPNPPPDGYAGLVVERGSTEGQTKLFWNEDRDRWEADEGDNVGRHILTFEKTFTETGLIVCQDDTALRRNSIDAWQRSLIHDLTVTTSCPDYDFSIFRDSSFSQKIFELTNINGTIDTQTALFYKDVDGYNELHYQITNHEPFAYLFDVSITAEVFFDGYTRSGGIVENFDNGDFCAPIFGELFSEDFEAYGIFDAYVGALLFDEEFDAYGVFDAYVGALIFDENFDSYDIFDAYAGAVLDSDDMNLLGF